MDTFLMIQLVLGILLIASVLMQQRSAGLGGAFGAGGSGGGGGDYYTRRGFEKFLTQATIVFAAAFIAVSFAQMFL